MSKQMLKFLNSKENVWDHIRKVIVNQYEVFHGYDSSDNKILSELKPSDIKFLVEEIGLEKLLKDNTLVDYLLGFRKLQISNVKTAASDNKDIDVQNSWGNRGDGGDRNMINTRYAMFHQMLQTLKPKKGQTIVDLGCCIGRLGLMMGELHPHLNYVGYEFWKERIEQASKIAKEKYPNVQYKHADFTDKNLKLDGDIFYIFWPNSNHKVMMALFDNLVKVAKKRNILIVIHRSSEQINEFPIKQIGKRQGNLEYYRIDFSKVKQQKKAA